MYLLVLFYQWSNKTKIYHQIYVYLTTVEAKQIWLNQPNFNYSDQMLVNLICLFF